MRKLFAILLVAALPATALGAAGGDWLGTTDAWSDGSNWSDGLSDEGSGGGNSFDKWSMDPGDMTGTELPLISAGDVNQWGWVRIRNGAVLTQTGGSQEWYSNTAGQRSAYNLYTGAQHDMTGGSHTCWERTSIGAYDGTADGAGTLNLWGDGMFAVLLGAEDAWGNPSLTVGTEGLIDIRDDGALRMQVDATSLLMGYETDGKLVAGESGFSLSYNTISWLGEDYVEVTAVPEPATVLLLGLGGLALILSRRRA